MIVRIDNNNPALKSNDAFLLAVKKKYGSRGVKQAEEYISYFSLMRDDPRIEEDEYTRICMGLRSLFFSMKEDNKKYIPKKYRH